MRKRRNVPSFSPWQVTFKEKRKMSTTVVRFGYSVLAVICFVASGFVPVDVSKVLLTAGGALLGIGVRREDKPSIGRDATAVATIGIGSLLFPV